MDSEEFSSADTAPQSGASGTGATLRAAREAKRLDLAHIAAETRIPLRHLEAIEAGQFESLPSRAYAIGFSRTYAKAVGLDDVAITEALRAELADGTMRRTVSSPGMEPGDPGRLPSSGLAWAAAGAVLVLAIGIYAFYNSYFGAGTEPGSLLVSEPTVAASAAPSPAAQATSPVPSGPVVLTALEDGIWLRLYEEGGARLVERTLAKGESVEVPVTARDPRINTGRPDALGVTVGGQPVAKLAERAQTISALPVSAAALTARATPTAATEPDAAAPATTASGPSAAVRRRAPAAAPVTTTPADTTSAAPAADPAPEDDLASANPR